MKLDIWRDIQSQTTIYKLEIADSDFLIERLTPFDMEVLRACESSALIHDTLLALELVTRRIYEKEKYIEGLSIKAEK